MNRLLLRQLKRAMQVENLDELHFLLAQLQLLADGGGFPRDVERAMRGFGKLLNRISSAYELTDQHLELFARSLELSSEDVQEAQAELLKVSRTDALTKLWNRGYWNERIEEEFARAKRMQKSTALVIFDIDNFKRINDSFGHLVGDNIIKATAEALINAARRTDFCSRFGGDEFSAILPGTPEEGAMLFAESLRSKIAGIVQKSQGVTVEYTISVGVAILDVDVNSTEDWLVRADGALYAAKRGGRNRVCSWRP